MTLDHSSLSLNLLFVIEEDVHRVDITALNQSPRAAGSSVRNAVKESFNLG